MGGHLDDNDEELCGYNGLTMGVQCAPRVVLIRHFISLVSSRMGACIDVFGRKIDHELDLGKILTFFCGPC